MKFSKSLTKQSFAEQTDINRIVERSKKAGGLPKPENPPVFADVSNVPDFATARQIVIDSQYAFDALPSRVRERFENDPGKMVDFLKNKDNLSEAIKLGLVTARSIADGDDETGNKKPKANGKKSAVKGEAKPNPTDPDLPLNE